MGENQPIHFSADKQSWDRKSNQVELYGHAVVSQQGETLTADYIHIDMNGRILDAKTNCTYITSDSVIRGDEMHFNMDTRTGTIVGGRVANSQFSLSGERINKLGNGRFQTHWGEYTTCRDCPQSWSILSEDVDMQIEGYAFMHNVTAKIEDTPTFWVPYLIVPIKTKRQSGFLFPPISVSSGPNGVMAVLPFFWAINRSSDMTFGLGEYTAKGLRATWEGEYALSPRSQGRADVFYLSDRNFQPNGLTPTYYDRWAFDVGQTQELPWNIEEKLKITQISDNLYIGDLGDVPGGGEVFLPSYFTFSYGSSDVSAYLGLRVYRNILNTFGKNPLEQATTFDPRTVQDMPSALVTTNDKFIFGSNIATGFTLGLDNFTRLAGAFDFDNSHVPFGSQPALGVVPIGGKDPIRKAVRVSATPSLYSAFRPFDVFSLIPSLQYKAYYYNFGQAPYVDAAGQSTTVADLYRGYPIFQAELSTQLEKIFDDPASPESPRMKHLIRPILTYSFIPDAFVSQSDPNHPFLKQIQTTCSPNDPTCVPRPWGGYNFDNNDFVPLTSTPNNVNYFVPLGNSLAYGFTTQWIRKRGTNSALPSYQRNIEFSAGQAINFRSENSQPFTRFFSNLSFTYDRWSWDTTYYYYPYLGTPPNTLSTSLSLILEKAVHQRVLTYERSLNLSYTYDQVTQQVSTGGIGILYSISDYFLPSLTLAYDFLHSVYQGSRIGLQFQSPSQCWRFSTGLSYNPNGTGSPINIDFDLNLNLTGGGFSGITEAVSQFASH